MKRMHLRGLPLCALRVFVAAVAAHACLSASVALAQQENWVATLAPAVKGAAYDPVEALVIQIPEQVPFEALLRLNLEVDAIDVTPLLAFESQVLTYRPPQPLSPGTHVLRLIETEPSGVIVERGTWSILVDRGQTDVAGVAASPGDGQPTSFSASATNALELSHRLADRGLQGLPSRSQASGGGYGETSYGNGPWSFKGNGNYLILSEKAQAPSGREIDIGEYDFTGRYSGEELFGEMTLGHQDLGAETFIMSDFSRRGLSASLGSADEAVSVTGFGLRTEAVTGHEEFTGLDDGDNRLHGFLAKANPIPGWGEDFAVTGIYYTGEGGAVGTGSGGDSATNQGSGWGIAAEGYLADRSIQVTGQFARANIEYGDVTVGAADAASNAWSSSVAYAPIRGEEVGGESMNLIVGVQYDRVGTFFSSLANPSLAADREGVLLYSDLAWGELSANALGLYQTNNVDDLAGVPTDRLLSFQFSGTYFPTIEPPTAEEVDWVGQPYLNFNLGIANNDRVDTPAGYAGAGTDNQTHTVTLGGGSNYAQWGWQLSQSASRFTDDTGNTSDTDSYLTDLSTNWMVSDALNLTGGLQWGQFLDTDLDTRTDTINLNLGVQAEIIPEVLKVNANYNLNLMGGDGDTPDSTIASGELEWTLLPPTVNNVGVALAFQGLLENRNGSADDSQNRTAWQIYSILRLSAPLAY